MSDSKASSDTRDRIGGFTIVRGPGRAFSLTRSRSALPILFWLSIGGLLGLTGASGFFDELVPAAIGLVLGLAMTLAGALTGLTGARAERLPVVGREIRFPGIRIEHADRDEAVFVDGERISMGDVRGPVVIDELVRADPKARRGGVPDAHYFVVYLATPPRLFHVARFSREADAIELAELLREGTGGPAVHVSDSIDQPVIWNAGGFPGVVLGIAGALVLAGFQFTADPVTRVVSTAIAAAALIGLAFLSRFLVARVGKRRAAAYAASMLDSSERSAPVTPRRSKIKKRRRSR